MTKARVFMNGREVAAKEVTIHRAPSPPLDGDPILEAAECTFRAEECVPVGATPDLLALLGDDGRRSIFLDGVEVARARIRIEGREVVFEELELTPEGERRNAEAIARALARAVPKT